MCGVVCRLGWDGQEGRVEGLHGILYVSDSFYCYYVPTGSDVGVVGGWGWQGHVFGVDPVCVRVSVAVSIGVSIGATISCVHDISLRLCILGNVSADDKLVIFFLFFLENCL